MLDILFFLFSDYIIYFCFTTFAYYIFIYNTFYHIIFIVFY